MTDNLDQNDSTNDDSTDDQPSQMRLDELGTVTDSHTSNSSSSDSHEQQTITESVSPSPSSDKENLENQQESDFSATHPLIVDFLESGVKDNKFTQKTANNRSATLRQYREFLEEKNTDIVDASIRHIERFLSSKSDVNRDETLRTKLVAIREFYKYIMAFKDEINCSMDYFELDQVDAPDSELETIEREALSKEEAKALLDAVDDHRDRLMMLLAILTGPRNAAIREIKLSDIDMEEKKIELADHKDDDSYTMPIPKKLYDYLDYYLEVVRPTYPTAETSPYLFLSKKGGRIETSARFENIVINAAEDAQMNSNHEDGIQDLLGEVHLTEAQKDVLDTDKDTRVFHRVTPHTLRHTFNELLKEKGVSLPVRSALLNHEDVDVTEKYYDDEIDHFDEFLEGIDGFL